MIRFVTGPCFEGVKRTRAQRAKSGAARAGRWSVGVGRDGSVSAWALLYCHAARKVGSPKGCFEAL